MHEHGPRQEETDEEIARREREARAAVRRCDFFRTLAAARMLRATTRGVL